jgi:hypothetical protein
MKRARGPGIGKTAYRLLQALAGGTGIASIPQPIQEGGESILIDANLARRNAAGAIEITPAGRAHLTRLNAAQQHNGIDPFLAQHAAIARREGGEPGDGALLVNESESPLAWLARRKGRDGRAMIEPHHFLAGERLRADFTRAQMMPRTTSNWESPVRSRGDAGATMHFSDAAIAARQRINHAMAAAGPEFSGLLLDVCCFLKGLEDIEQERRWPARSAKVVLQLALDRLARHYGLEAQALGKQRLPMVAWSAPYDAGVVE